ncbi:MAG: class II glutamine amidotransferase [Methanosphaera sp.]|nr:class II glutamine amidotransferase [Methanosphaera sp.]
MCELFGITSKRCIRINDYLNQFYSHCEQHPHGWGLAIMQQNQLIIEKQPVKASQSKELQQILEKPIIVEHAFAHIRLATMGYMDSFNCHPFSKIDNSGRTWTLIHNGTIFNYEPLNRYISQQLGETDSERILLFIIDKINEAQDAKNAPLTEQECFNFIEGIIRDLSEGNKLNLMLFNGEFMYVHANYKQSLYYLQAHDSIFISTRPLSKENWKEFPINKVISLKNGEIYKRGRTHNHEYIITGEHFDYIVDHMSEEMKNKLIEKFGDLNYAKEYSLSHQ